MKEHSGEFSVEGMAKALGVSRSGYYAWQGRAKSQRALQQQLFDLEVKAAFEAGKGHYGRDRVQLALGLRGRKASRKRVGASMDRQGLRFKPKRRGKVATTNSKHGLPVAQNLLNRNFSTDAPNKVLVSDITYLPSRSGWLYLTVFIDLFSRMVVGWHVSDSLSHEGVLLALQRAIWRRKFLAGAMIHSDRGVQYCCEAFRKALAAHQFVQSMSRKGNCWDNAVAESFFGTLKGEWLCDMDLYDREHAQRELFKYIEQYYNGQRIHTTLGMSPVMYEKMNRNKCA
jgi:transposase InsO family protein